MSAHGAFARSARVVAVAALLAGCSVARITNAAAPACHASLRGGFESILLAQHEQPDVAAEVASAYADTLARIDYGPRPFEIVSPSGTAYGFFFDTSDGQCLLRLSGWRRGSVKQGSDMSPLDSRPLAGCSCTR